MLKHKYSQLVQQFITTLKILPETLDELANNLGRTDKQTIVNELVGELLLIANTTTNNIITPWTIELAKGIDDMYKIFGHPRLTLLVAVIFNGMFITTHECTEELMFGILSVTSFSDAFTFYLQDVNIPITLEDIQENYISEGLTKRFSATLPIDNVTFNTTDVIQGIITASNWIGRDPHDFIENIRDRSRGNILLDFSNITQPTVTYSYLHLFEKKRGKRQ